MEELLDGWDYGPAFDPKRHRDNIVPLDPVRLAVLRDLARENSGGMYFRPEYARLLGIRRHRAESLRVARQVASLSQHEVAERAGIDRSTVSRIESAQLDLREPGRSRLARVLDEIHNEMVAYLDRLNLPHAADPAVLEERNLQQAAFSLVYHSPERDPQEWFRSQVWELAAEEAEGEDRHNPLGSPRDRAMTLIQSYTRLNEWQREALWLACVGWARHWQAEGEMSEEEAQEIAR